MFYWFYHKAVGVVLSIKQNGLVNTNMTIKDFCHIKSSLVSTICLVWLHYLVLSWGGGPNPVSCQHFYLCQGALLFNLSLLVFGSLKIPNKYDVYEFLMRFQHSSIKVVVKSLCEYTRIPCAHTACWISCRSVVSLGLRGKRQNGTLMLQRIHVA